MPDLGDGATPTSSLRSAWQSWAGDDASSAQQSVFACLRASLGEDAVQQLRDEPLGQAIIDFGDELGRLVAHVQQLPPGSVVKRHQRREHVENYPKFIQQLRAEFGQLRDDESTLPPVLQALSPSDRDYLWSILEVGLRQVALHFKEFIGNGSATRPESRAPGSKTSETSQVDTGDVATERLRSKYAQNPELKSAYSKSLNDVLAATWVPDDPELLQCVQTVAKRLRSEAKWLAKCSLVLSRHLNHVAVVLGESDAQKQRLAFLRTSRERERARLEGELAALSTAGIVDEMHRWALNLDDTAEKLTQAPLLQADVLYAVGLVEHFSNWEFFGDSALPEVKIVRSAGQMLAERGNAEANVSQSFENAVLRAKTKSVDGLVLIKQDTDLLWQRWKLLGLPESVSQSPDVPPAGVVFQE